MTLGVTYLRRSFEKSIQKNPRQIFIQQGAAYYHAYIANISVFLYTRVCSVSLIIKLRKGIDINTSSSCKL